MYKGFFTDYMGTLKYDGFPKAIGFFENRFCIASGRLQQVVTRKYWPLWSLGLINEEEFWQRSFEEINGRLSKIDPRELTRYIVDFSDGLYTPMIEFFKMLKNEKIPTGLITNISPELYRFLVETEKLPELFDQVVASFQVGVRKPNERIYRMALQRLSAQPNEVVYVDNEDIDVKGAEALGMTGVNFTSVEETVPLLERLYREGR